MVQENELIGAVMFKLLSAVVAAAGIAGVVTFLPGATDGPLAASSLAKPEQVADACANCNGPPLEGSRLPLLTAERFTPSASLLRVSDDQILLEKSQIQDW